jgi:3-oxoacyl-[acyl-carrier protein] reductase
MNNSALSEQVAVITGAGRGIGRAIAIGYAKAGAAVCCSARSTREIDETVELISAFGGKAISVAADVTDFASIKALFETAAEKFGGIDIVVASAGGSVENTLVEESDPEKWKHAIDTNLIGSYHTAKAAIPFLRTRGAGKMIFIGSGMGHRSAPTRSAYAASKAGLWMLVRILAQELVTHNISVNELIPGPVLTAFIKGREGALQGAAAGGEWMKQPEDVVPLALFLATQPVNGPTAQSFSLARREL